MSDALGSALGDGDSAPGDAGPYRSVGGTGVRRFGTPRGGVGKRVGTITTVSVQKRKRLLAAVLEAARPRPVAESGTDTDSGIDAGFDTLSAE
ncbi:hypothetical protein [Halorussus salinus]|uniref:hypothetical protein n=1 Tax=Halorussus salinus TaxID=1364935 RepID=UPI0010923A8F|nr:hypothetical protein [Halorussus salinus]